MSVTLNLARGPQCDRCRRRCRAHRRRCCEPGSSWPDPGRAYPDDVLADAAHLTDWAFVRDGDLALIHQPPDVLGINYYSPSLVAALRPEDRDTLTKRWVNDPQGADEPSIWPGNRSSPTHCRRRDRTPTWVGVSNPSRSPSCCCASAPIHPGLPLLITENGAAFPDEAGSRRQHPRPTTGSPTYTVTSTCARRDQRRCGRPRLLPVVTAGQLRVGVGLHEAVRHRARRLRQDVERRPKQSAYWYRDVIRANALPD